MTLRHFTVSAILAVLLPLSAFPQQKSQASSSRRFLVENIKPTDSYKCGIHKSSDYTIRMGGFDWKEGFVLGHSTGPTRYGYAVFPLGGKYESISFVMGVTLGGADSPLMTKDPNPYDHSVGLVGIYADGVKILDEKLAMGATPRFFTINVSGVNELKFALERNEMFVGFADVILWTAGQQPQQTQNKPAAKPSKIQLVKDKMPYKTKASVIYPDHNNTDYERVSQLGAPKSIKVNGVEYTNGLYQLVTPGFVEDNISDAHFNLQGQYSKLGLMVGPVDYDQATDGKAWFTVKADGKTLFEEEISSTDIARREVLDINHCDHLEIEFQSSYRTCPLAVVEMYAYPDGEDPEAEARAALAAATAADAERLHKLPSPCKLISNIEPYAVGSHVDQPVYKGQSQYITFSMGGKKFNEGVILKGRNNVLYDDTPAFATFALAGEFDYVTFTSGWISKCGVLKNDVLQVFCDDRLVYEDMLFATYPNKEHTVALNKCKSLKIQLKGSPSLFRPAFGIADIVLYRGSPVENDLFSHPAPECPPTIDLLDLGLPYIHYNSPMKDYPEKIIYDGSTKKHYVELGEERIYKGFMLQTIEHFDLEAGVTGDASTGIMASTLGASFMVGTVGSVAVSAVFPFGALLALASGGTARESSCAAFNTWGEYDYVTFTVACVKPGNTDKRNRLLIGADGQVVGEYEVREQMAPRTKTVRINRCKQLMFWLECGDGTSGNYLFYDIKLGKGEPAL